MEHVALLEDDLPQVRDVGIGTHQSMSHLIGVWLPGRFLVVGLPFASNDLVAGVTHGDVLP